MAEQLNDWNGKGFGRSPELRVTGPSGLTVYRCWGGTSGELGSFFSVVKPESVYDAETKFNIADWDNLIHFVSTFKIKEDTPYWIGPVLHGQGDICQPATQVFLEKPVEGKVTLVASKQVLKQDASVSPKAGNA